MNSGLKGRVYGGMRIYPLLMSLNGRIYLLIKGVCPLLPAAYHIITYKSVDFLFGRILCSQALRHVMQTPIILPGLIITYNNNYSKKKQKVKSVNAVTGVHRNIISSDFFPK